MGPQGLRSAQVAVCVPFPYLFQAQQALAGSRVAWGAQNVSQHAKGAYTGRGVGRDGAGVRLHLRDRRALGAPQPVRRGRRDVAAKFGAALEAGLVPILCVGETLAQREAGCHRQRGGGQLDAVVERFGIAGARPGGDRLRAGVGDRHGAYGHAGAGAGGARVLARRGSPASDASSGAAGPDSLRWQRQGDPTLPTCSRWPDIDGGLIGGASLAGR